jgi:group I intron endonuclease
MKISHMPKACGVYQITSPSGKYYIGKSENMYRRMLNHKSDAKKKEHYNPKLKNSFAKYGDKMTCKVLALADKKDVCYLETYYINLFWGDPNCMNVALDPVGCDKTANRNGYTSGYFVTYWTRSIFKVDSLGEWAKKIGKCSAYRGSKSPGQRSKCAMFQTIEECNDWLNQMNSIVISKIELEIKPKERPKPAIPNNVLLERKRKKNFRYGYHIRCPNGRVTLARNTQELKRYSMLDGYERRRFGQPWKENRMTPGKSITGKHYLGMVKTWNSVGACSRDIGLSYITILKHARGERIKTMNGWFLQFAC